MRHKIKTLVIRTETNIQRNDLLISRNEVECRSIIDRLQHLSAEMIALNQLIISLYPSGNVSKEKILSAQRRQAVIKRKIAELRMEVSQGEVEIRKLELIKVNLMEKRVTLQKKLNKYQHLSTVERHKKMLRDACIEQNEIEERVSWLH